VSTTGGVRGGAADPRLELPRRAVAHLAEWLVALGRPARLAWGGSRIRPARLPAAVFAAASVLAVAAAMVWVDSRAIGLAHRLPAWLIAAFGKITDFGRSGWFLWPVGLILVGLAALTRPGLGRVVNLVAAALVVRLGFIFLAIAIPGLAVAIVKRLIGRARPSDFGPFHYVPLSWRPDYASLPSGHSTAAFAAAVAIGAVWPRARAWLWVYAGIIAASRVIVSAHYPSDVIAGAAVGTVGALLIRKWFAVRRLGFVVQGDGSVRAWPGPSRRRLARLLARLVGPAHEARS